MKTLGKLSSFAAAAGVSAMLTVASVPAQAQLSPEGSNALLGAGIGAIAGAALGHGRTGPVLGGAAAGAVLGALATPHRGYYYDRYGYGYPYGYGYSTYGYSTPYYGSSYYPYTTYSYSYPYGYSGYYPYSSYYGYYGY